MADKGIILDNAATSGSLTIRGPASGNAVLNVPATDSLVAKSMFVFDNATGEFVFQDVPADVVVPTNVSAFTNDAGYQTAADVASATANFQTAAQVTAIADAAAAPKANTADLKTVAFTGSYTDLINQPTAASLGAVETSQVGVANGVASLGADGKVPSAQLPAYVDQIVEVATYSALPVTGTAGVIYVTLDTNKEYRWGGSAYVELVASPGSTDAVPEGTVNLYFTGARAAAAAPVQSVAGKTGAVTLTASDVSGLATVATTGSYNDLADKPTIPTVPTNVSAFTNDAGYQTAADVTTAIAGKANTADLATVATSGSYNDLTNKPVIPTVPTNVSTFTNDAGYLTAIPVASATTLGGVKEGPGTSIAGDGTITVTGAVVDPVNPGNTSSVVVATVSTTDATDTLALNLPLTDNSVVLFTADVVVKNGNGSSGGGYSLEGVIRRATGAATVTLIGGAMKAIVAEDVVAWDANATANTSTGALEIRVKGAAANNLMWFVSTRVTRIG